MNCMERQDVLGIKTNKTAKLYYFYLNIDSVKKRSSTFIQKKQSQSYHARTKRS